VLRTVDDQPTLWDAILPAELPVLPSELARVDALLDDPVFFVPFAVFLDARIGRPSIPMETYLRLMFLKFRYRLGYESLCREVSDSISWQRFCRIPFGTRAPHPTTLMKITTRCGDAAVTGLNEALLVKAAAAKLLRTDKVRANTTVVEADVAYPTDSGLLAKAVVAMARTVERIKSAGGATRTRAQDRRRSTGRRARSIASKLRLRGELQRDQAQAAVRLPPEDPLEPFERFRVQFLYEEYQRIEAGRILPTSNDVVRLSEAVGVTRTATLDGLVAGVRARQSRVLMLRRGAGSARPRCSTTSIGAWPGVPSWPMSRLRWSCRPPTDCIKLCGPLLDWLDRPPTCSVTSRAQNRLRLVRCPATGSLSDQTGSAVSCWRTDSVASLTAADRWDSVRTRRQQTLHDAD
jgi:IS5 family transposase